MPAAEAAVQQAAKGTRPRSHRTRRRFVVACMLTNLLKKSIYQLTPIVNGSDWVVSCQRRKEGRERGLWLSLGTASNVSSLPPPTCNPQAPTRGSVPSDGGGAGRRWATLPPPPPPSPPHQQQQQQQHQLQPHPLADDAQCE